MQNFKPQLKIGTKSPVERSNDATDKSFNSSLRFNNYKSALGPS